MTKPRSRCFVLIDETGSMHNDREITMSAVNEYLDTLEMEAPKTRVTITKFNSSGVVDLCQQVKVGKAQRLNRTNYIPSALTPLWDAVGRMLKKAEDAYNKGDRVLCVILTDGNENCSIEYNSKNIATKVKECTNKGWQFVFLGADIDAWNSAKLGGFEMRQTTSFNKADLSNVMANAAAASAAYMAGVSTGYFSTDGGKDLRKDQLYNKDK